MIRSLIRFVPAIALLTGLALSVSACGMFYDKSKRKSSSRSQPVAAQPVTVAPSEPFAVVPPPGSPAIPIPASGVHRVERGNTVYSVSRLYGVPVRAIIETNGLTSPYLLKVGENLAIPNRRGHKVVKGETVYSISRSYGIDISELTRANEIAPPYTIVIGQDLVIPTVDGVTARVGVPAATSVAAAAGTQVAAPAVQPTSGGTVDVEALPAPSAAISPTPTPTPTPPAPAAKATPPPQPVAKATPKQIEALPKAPARAGSTFLWPVKGKLVSRYGNQQDGQHNDGINIAAKRGTTVQAAENGVVAYAGNELRGFGNLLLVKHAYDRVRPQRYAAGRARRQGQEGPADRPRGQYRQRRLAATAF
jgi:murein DD-endopeptidase MepM/ murein hydrolase activator NlpD